MNLADPQRGFLPQPVYLQQSRVAREFYGMFPNIRAFTDSTAAARANGILGGHVEQDRVKRLVGGLGVSPQAAQTLLEVSPRSGAGCGLP